MSQRIGPLTKRLQCPKCRMRCDQHLVEHNHFAAWCCPLCNTRHKHGQILWHGRHGRKAPKPALTRYLEKRIRQLTEQLAAHPKAWGHRGRPRKARPEERTRDDGEDS